MKVRPAGGGFDAQATAMPPSQRECRCRVIRSSHTRTVPATRPGGTGFAREGQARQVQKVQKRSTPSTQGRAGPPSPSTPLKPVTPSESRGVGRLLSLSRQPGDAGILRPPFFGFDVGGGAALGAGDGALVGRGLASVCVERGFGELVGGGAAFWGAECAADAIGSALTEIATSGWTVGFATSGLGFVSGACATAALLLVDGSAPADSSPPLSVLIASAPSAKTARTTPAATGTRLGTLVHDRAVRVLVRWVEVPDAAPAASVPASDAGADGVTRVAAGRGMDARGSAGIFCVGPISGDDGSAARIGEETRGTTGTPGVELATCCRAR
jgi:hypothetical protein